MYSKDKKKGITGCMLVLLIFVFTMPGSAQNQLPLDASAQLYPDALDIRKPILLIPTWFNVTNVETTTTKEFPVPVPGTVHPSYIYLDIRVALKASGIMLGSLHITLRNQTKTVKFSSRDFDPFGQIILRYEDMEITKQEQLRIVFEFDGPAFFVTELSAKLLVFSIDMYMIEPPVSRPLIVPINQTVYNTGFFEEEHLDFDIFLPAEQTFSLDINSSAEIKITYLKIVDANQYNAPKEQEYNTTHSFIFRTNEKNNYRTPKKVTLRFIPIRKIPIDLILTGNLKKLESIEIVLLSPESEILINAALIMLVAVPLGKLYRDRKNKTLRKRLRKTN